MLAPNHTAQLKRILIVLILGLSLGSSLPLCGKEIRKDSTREFQDERISRRQLRDILIHYLEQYPKLKFTHCTFYYDPAKDTINPQTIIYSTFNSLDPVFFDLTFDNCVIEEMDDGGSIYDNYWFHSDVLFSNNSDISLYISGSRFDRSLSFKKCEFAMLFVSGSSISSLSFEKCKGFASFSGDYFFARPDMYRFSFDEGSQFKDVNFYGCEFFDDSESAQKTKDKVYANSDGVYFASLSTERLNFTNCIFNSVLYLSELSVTHSFTFKDNKLLRALSFSGNNEFPLFNTTLKYDEIKDKIFTEYAFAFTPVYSYYLLDYTSEADYGDDGELFSDAYSSSPFVSEPSSLIATYSKLLTIFKNNNDDDSYNACYKKLKAIETMASKVEYKNHPSLESYFEWKMNDFLDTFCDYGTNPVKSLVFSVKVILFFCLVYILFPSEDDNLKYRKLTGAISRYIHHFANKQSIREQSDNSYQAELTEINLLREELKANVTTLPPIVVVFGKPLHGFMAWVARLQHRARNVVEFNIYHDWHSLTWISKWKTSAIITASLTGFLLWGLIMRLLNAIALSMNAFVTLGYGEIEASGVARYFCVLEGLVGWFLLSIFSVSLISQILQ